MIESVPMSDRQWVWLLAVLLNVSGMLYACGGPEKPILAPNPIAADCIIDRTKAQFDCVKEAGTEKAADECIARVKAAQECVDGGSR